MTNERTDLAPGVDSILIDPRELADDDIPTWGHWLGSDPIGTTYRDGGRWHAVAWFGSPASAVDASRATHAAAVALLARAARDRNGPYV